jgi:hypothetical protein
MWLVLSAASQEVSAPMAQWFRVVLSVHHTLSWHYDERYVAYVIR